MSQAAQVFRLVLVASFVATPWAPSPAAANADGNRDFEITQSSVRPNSASSGSTITVSMTAENVGSESRAVLLRFEIVVPDERIQKAAEKQRAIEPGGDYPQIWTYSGTSTKGTYTVYLSVFDASTYRRYDQVQHTFTITESNKRPRCERSNPIDGMITRTSGQPFTLEVRCTDDDANLQGGQWQIDDQDVQQESSAGGSNTESHTFTLATGSYWIDYYAWDDKGAESFSVGWSVTVEESGGTGGSPGQAPTCSRQSPTTWENTAEPGESFALTASCSDPDGDLDYGDWHMGDSFVETAQIEGESDTATRSFTLSETGSYVIHFIPRDRAGTYGQAASWQYTAKQQEEPNRAPVVVRREPSWDGEVELGTLIRFYVEAEDKDAWPILKRAWEMQRPNGEREKYDWASSTGGIVRAWTWWNVTLNDYGPWRFRIIWTDADGLAATHDWNFVVPRPETTAPHATPPAFGPTGELEAGDGRKHLQDAYNAMAVIEWVENVAEATLRIVSPEHGSEDLEYVRLFEESNYSEVVMTPSGAVLASNADSFAVQGASTSWKRVSLHIEGSSGYESWVDLRVVFRPDIEDCAFLSMMKLIRDKYHPDASVVVAETASLTLS